MSASGFEYVCTTYKVPARRGRRVRTRAGKLGTITSATHHVKVRLDGQRMVLPYHPTDLDYLSDDSDDVVLFERRS